MEACAGGTFEKQARRHIEGRLVRVTCIVKRFSHHTASGGYDRLAAAVRANVIMRKQIPGLFGKAANQIWRYLTPKKDYPAGYQVSDRLTELEALTVGFLRPPDVLHVLYSSQIDLLIKRRKLLRCALVVTFHAPFEDTGPHRFDAYPKGLGIDMAVVVATSQVMPMQRWIEPHKIVFIPHGIDTDGFRPDGQMLDPAKMRVLIVGHHMRDWNVIHRTIDEINHRRLNVEFHVVTAEPFFPYFVGCANVVFHSQISESELVGLYRSADILFLPVINATANNAILEALACGTPVISTLVGGVPDYVNDESGWLLPVGDVAGHVDLIASLHGNRELAHRRRRAARTQALKFDWRLVAEQMIAVYAAAESQRQCRN
jgi:glycosyltransferase involved in cell wall biosynthesis